MNQLEVVGGECPAGEGDESEGENPKGRQGEAGLVGSQPPDDDQCQQQGLCQGDARRPLVEAVVGDTDGDLVHQPLHVFVGKGDCHGVGEKCHPTPKSM